MKIATYRLLIILCMALMSFTEVNAQANAGSDREICLYDTLKVTGTGLVQGDTGSYRWRDIGTNTVLSANENLVVKILSTTARQFELRLLVIKSGQNILSYDTFTLSVNALPSFSNASVPPRCYNDGAINLTTNCIVRAFSGDLSRSSCSVRYYQNKTPSWISGAPNGPYVYDFPKYINNSQIPKSGAIDSVCFDYTDYKGCYNKACKAIRLNPNPIVEVKDAVFTQCNGEPALNPLVIKPFSKVGGIETFTCTNVPAGSGLNRDSVIRYNSSVVPALWTLKSGTIADSARTGIYAINYCFKDALTGCMSCDTTSVEVLKVPLPFISSMPKKCLNQDTLVLNSFVLDKRTGRPYTGGKWRCIEFNGSRNLSIGSVKAALESSVIGGKYFYWVSGSGSYLLKFEDTSTGCGFMDSAVLNVYGLPIVQISVPDTVAADGGLVTLNNIVPAGPVGTWSGTGVSGNTFDPSVSPQGKLFEGPYKIYYSYTHPLTGCTSSDSQSMLVQSPPTIALDAINAKSGIVFSANFSNSVRRFTDSSFQKCIWDFGNGNGSVYFNPGLVYYADSGTYTVRQTIWDSRVRAEDSITITFDYRTTGSSIQELLSGLYVYPNPVQGVLNVQVLEACELRLSNNLGKCITKGVQLSSGHNVLSVAGLPDGVYILSLHRPGSTIRKTIVIRQ